MVTWSSTLRPRGNSRDPLSSYVGSSETKGAGLELVAREPVFPAVYVDGASKGTTAAQMLQWFKRQGVSPFAVWKVKKKSVDSAFCIGLRPKHAKIYSNPTLPPENEI